MTKIISASLNLSKIDKSKIQDKDSNGNPYKDNAKYYPIQIIINDTPDAYNNDVSISTGQTKEDRDRKDKRVFLGNGRVIWTDENKIGSNPVTQTKESTQDDFSDLPF